MWAKYLMLLIKTNIKYLALLDALIFNTKYKASLPGTHLSPYDKFQIRFH